MRDVAAVTGKVMTAKVMRAMDEVEARRRNALSATKPGFARAPTQASYCTTF